MSANSESHGKSLYLINGDVENNLRVGREVLTNRVVANTVRLHKSLEVDGDRKNPGKSGQHLVSRGPGLSPEWSDAMPDSESVPDFTDFDYAIIGGGESGITTLMHLVNTCKNPDAKIVLITDGQQQDDIQFRKSFLTFPQNLPEGDLRDELLKIVEDGSSIGGAQGGYSNFNLGGNAFRNKFDNIYAYRWSNNTDPNKPNDPKGGFDYGSWVVRELGGFCNINGGNAGIDPRDYRVTNDDTTWNGVDTGLKEDNLDDLLDIYKTYYPNLRQRPVKLLPGESYPATQESVNNYVRLFGQIENGLQNSSMGVKNTAFSIDNDNFFVSGRREWNAIIKKIQMENPNVEVIYNTEVNEIRNADKDVKTIVANRRQVKLLARKIIVSSGQIGSTKLVEQMIHDNLPLFNNVKPQLNYRENTGTVIITFLANTKEDLVPQMDTNKRSIVVGRELYDTSASTSHSSSTVEVQTLLNINLTFDPHFLRLVGLFASIEFKTVDQIFVGAGFVDELKYLIAAIQGSLLFFGQRFLDVRYIKDPTYEPDLKDLTTEVREKLYNRWNAYTWDNNFFIPGEIEKAVARGDTENAEKITALYNLLKNDNNKYRCIPYGWITLNGFIVYAPSKLTSLLGNIGNIVDHDDNLQREFKLDPDSEWNNDRSEAANARQFRLIENLIGTKVNYRGHDTENTSLSPKLLTQFKNEYVNTFKNTIKNVLYGPNSPKFGILKNISKGQYNIIQEYPGGLGFGEWVANDSLSPRNMNHQISAWSTTGDPIDLNMDTDSFLLKLQQNIQCVWHATQHFAGIVDHLTNQIPQLKHVWVGDQCAWHNITPSSSAVLSSLMGMRAVESACSDDNYDIVPSRQVPSRPVSY
jgi:hypothetical protein